MTIDQAGNLLNDGIYTYTWDGERVAQPATTVARTTVVVVRVF